MKKIPLKVVTIQDMKANDGSDIILDYKRELLNMLRLLKTNGESMRGVLNIIKEIDTSIHNHVILDTNQHLFLKTVVNSFQYEFVAEEIAQFVDDISNAEDVTEL